MLEIVHSGSQSQRREEQAAHRGNDSKSRKLSLKPWFLDHAFTNLCAEGALLRLFLGKSQSRNVERHPRTEAGVIVFWLSFGAADLGPPSLASFPSSHFSSASEKAWLCELCSHKCSESSLNREALSCSLKTVARQVPNACFVLDLRALLLHLMQWSRDVNGSKSP